MTHITNLDPQPSSGRAHIAAPKTAPTLWVCELCELPFREGPRLDAHIEEHFAGATLFTGKLVIA